MACNTTFDFLPTEQWKKGFGMTMAVLSFLATFENAFVLITIYWYQVLHTKSNKILASLATSDFLTGVTVALLFAIQLLNKNLTNNCTIDLVRRYLSTFLIGASVLTICLISYDRSLHLRKLMSYKLTSRKLYLSLFVCWVVPLLTPLLRKIDDSEQVYSAFIVTIVMLILIILICSYIMLVVALHKHKKKRSRDRMFSYVKMERKATMTVMILITCFVFSIMPICIHHFLNVTKRFSDESLAKSYVIGMTMCVVNSIVNPVVYYYRTPYMRKHMLKLIGYDPITERQVQSVDTEVEEQTY